MLINFKCACHLIHLRKGDSQTLKLPLYFDDVTRCGNDWEEVKGRLRLVDIFEEDFNSQVYAFKPAKQF